MKTTRLITVTLASCALFGVLGYAFVNLNISLASLIDVTVGTLASAGLFGLLLWDTGREFKARETAPRADRGRTRTTRRAELRRHTVLAGC
jgi:hypothetical protein